MEKTYKFRVGENVTLVEDCDIRLRSYYGRVGVIAETLTFQANWDYEVKYDDCVLLRVQEYELEAVKSLLPVASVEDIQAKDVRDIGRFEKIGNEIGKFTDTKNRQYGSSVDVAYEMMRVLMARYKNDDNTYTIPESLIAHILLQVRMMDKQNRIFNNPSGKGDSESPYNDLAGYSIIGIDMRKGVE